MGDEELKSSQPVAKLSPSSKTSGVGILQQIEEEDKLESLSWNERMKLKKREKAERLKAEKETSGALKESKQKEVKAKLTKQVEPSVPNEKSNNENSVADLPNLSSSFKTADKPVSVIPATFSGMASKPIATSDVVLQTKPSEEEKVEETKATEKPIINFTIEEEEKLNLADAEKNGEAASIQRVVENLDTDHAEQPKKSSSAGIVSFSFEDDGFEDMTASVVNTSAKEKEFVSNSEAAKAKANITPVVVSFSFEDDEPIAQDTATERKFVPNVAFSDEIARDERAKIISEHEEEHLVKSVPEKGMSKSGESAGESDNSSIEAVSSFSFEPGSAVEQAGQSKNSIDRIDAEKRKESRKSVKKDSEARKTANDTDMTKTVNENDASLYSLDYEKTKEVSDARPKERPIDRMHRRQNNAMLIKLIVQVAIILIFFTVIFRNTVVSSASMEPTLVTGDFAVFNKLAYTHSQVDRGDIITFYSREYQENFSKRVIGIAGDTVEFHDGYVFINGLQADESAYLPVDMETNCNKSFIVPDNCVFVLGDNRTNSYDSRFFMNPYISCDDIVGKYIGSIHKMW